MQNTCRQGPETLLKVHLVAGSAGSDSGSGMLPFLSFIKLSPVAGSKDRDEIWGISLVMDEMWGEVLSGVTGCPNRGAGEGNERGKRHF